MAEEGSRHEELTEAIAEVKNDITVIACVLRPRPIESVDGRRVAFFTTAPEDAHDVLGEHLRSEYGADLVGVSGNLARREALREDIERLDADVYLVEIKAAAIDVVAEEASQRGAAVVFADNDVLALPGQPDLDEELRRLVA